MPMMHQSEREKRGNCHWCSPRSPVSYRSQALLLEISLFVPVFIFSTAIHVGGEIRTVDLPFLKIFNYSLLLKFWWWICEWSELGTKMKNQSTLTCMLMIGILCIHCGAAPQRFGSPVAENSREEEPANGTTTAAERDPASIAQMVQRSIDNSTRRRELAYLSCGTGNPIDDCWRCDLNWESHRKRLADCAIGFGRNAQGGKKGKYYVVTDNSDDDALNPRRGTLRYAVIQTEPLWIIFQRDMVIQLKEELIMNYFKTIDGRGVNVHIANGPCITIHGVRHIIIHGIHIHDCVPAGNALVRDSPTHYEWRPICDGDGISISGASNIWVDHVSMARCADGLIDATRGSTAITISNSYFTQHNEVMLLGHHDNYTGDVRMQVTVAFNHFGEGLVQRMPRCRHGYFHVVNNDYSEWGMYAIGGSANPTINSQGNRFMASANPSAKEVTKRLNQNSDEWKSWNWRSDGDMMLNGAYFKPSGTADSWAYVKASSLEARPSTNVGPLTRDAGVLNCSSGARC